MSHETLFLRESVASRPDASTGWGFTEEIHGDLVNRLKVLGLFGAGIWAFYLLFFEFVLPWMDSHHEDETGFTLPCIIGMAASVVLVMLVRAGRMSSHRLLQAGMVYATVNAAVISHINVQGCSVTWEYPGVSWVALWIIIYATLIPGRPKTMLLWGLVTAAIEPAFAYVAWLDSPAPDRSFLQVLPFWKENFLAAVLAVIPAKLVHRLSQQVREARQLGSYRLRERIGQGGMGEVWRAEHRLLARPAAVKLIRPEMLGSAAAPTVLRRFEREARATATLESPHSIELLDFGIDRDGTFYYVMELLDGFDLDDLVTGHGPVPPARVAHTLRQIAHSLADAHARGLVHRDIKPANVFLCRKGLDHDFVKVLDFGLVLGGPEQESDSMRITRQGITTGTPAFMAPEQAAGSPDLDHRADLYALGCVGYWLLTGQFVFQADSPVEMAAAHLREKPVPPSQRVETPVPQVLDDLLMSLLDKDPGGRPQTAVELIRRLDVTGLPQKWSGEDARDWWESHAPSRPRPPSLD